jgi:uncharacterized membrane protein YcjF (UPF0283 family)
MTKKVKKKNSVKPIVVTKKVKKGGVGMKVLKLLGAFLGSAVVIFAGVWITSLFIGTAWLTNFFALILP